MDAKGIVAVLRALGVDSKGVRPHQNGKNVQTRCPLAAWTHPSGIDNNPSMTVEINAKGPSRYRCWSANCKHKGLFKNLVLEVWRKKEKPGELANLVESVLDSEKGDVGVEIEKTAKMLLGDEEDKTAHEDHDVRPESEIEEFTAVGPPKYFFKRGFTKLDAKEWEVGTDKHSLRMTIPVRRADGKLIGLQGRALLESDPRKYFNYWSFPKSKYLYGEHLIDRKTLKGIIVVEGATDAWRVRQSVRGHAKWGGLAVVAMMGTTLSGLQRKKLLAYDVPIYQFPDNNDGGGSLAACDDMADDIRGRVMLCRLDTPAGKDPGDCDGEKILQLLDEAWVC